MVATRLRSRGVRWWSAAAFCALLAGCQEYSPYVDSPSFDDPADPGGEVNFGPGAGDNDGSLDFGQNGPEMPACNPDITVDAAGPALLVRDPEVLERFPLERVLTRILERSGSENKSPDELLRRLFDTENSEADGVFPDVIHCDSEGNQAFKNGPAVNCSRAEGALAKSEGLFQPGHPDHFVPIALVNRFDLAPSTQMTCGEFRVVYAKESGLTDPDNRLFLIFEASPTNPFPGNINGCRPALELWKSLETVDDPYVRAARLEKLYFQGVGAMNSVIHPEHLGLLSSEEDTYGSQRGQVRVSQGMQEPWEMREFSLKFRASDKLPKQVFFAPATVKNNPLPELFGAAQNTQKAVDFRQNFLFNDLFLLASPQLGRVRMQINNAFNAGQSALEGPAESSYLEKALGSEEGKVFLADIEKSIKSLPQTQGLSCPEDDPLTAETLLARAATQTCAGCHAPERFAGSERKLGCGMVWPATTGPAHIDEHGQLSPALTEVFLPQRAGVMATFLQACSATDIMNNLQPVGGGGIPK